MRNSEAIKSSKFYGFFRTRRALPTFENAPYNKFIKLDLPFYIVPKGSVTHV